MPSPPSQEIRLPQSESRARKAASTSSSPASTQRPSASLSASSERRTPGAPPAGTPFSPSVGSSDTAVSRSSGGSSSGGIATFRPTPITAQPSSGRASTRTPATFRSPIQTSFGHFTWQRTGATDSAASQTAIGTASGSSAASPASNGRSSAE